MKLKQIKFETAENWFSDAASRHATTPIIATLASYVAKLRQARTCHMCYWLLVSLIVGDYEAESVSNWPNIVRQGIGRATNWQLLMTFR